MRLLHAVLPLAILGCASTGEKPPEDDVPTDLDGKLDSFHAPTDHGAIAFGSVQLGKLTAQQGYHTWEFSLSGTASVHAFTSRVPHDASLDTVLYLYKKQANGAWGSYIARNDDASSSTIFSSLTKSLGAGDYRALVKGYSASTAGRFDLQVDCTGAGCAPATTAGTCLFGAVSNDLKSDPNLLWNEQMFTSPTGMTALDQQRAILAMHQSTHTDVTTIEQAFAAADGGEIDFIRLYDLAGARSYTAVEYGAGDNTYGEIFAEDTTTEAAAIHDTDIEACTVAPQHCMLGQNFSDLRTSGAWTETSHTTVTMASQLSGVAATDALTAIRVAYSSATSLANGLTLIDQGRLEVRVFTNNGTGVVVDSYDYGAGDNSYGQIFMHGSTTNAAIIHDLDFYACSIFTENNR